MGDGAGIGPPVGVGDGSSVGVAPGELEGLGVEAGDGAVVGNVLGWGEGEEEGDGTLEIPLRKKRSFKFPSALNTPVLAVGELIWRADPMLRNCPARLPTDQPPGTCVASTRRSFT